MHDHRNQCAVMTAKQEAKKPVETKKETVVEKVEEAVVEKIGNE